MRTCLWIIVAVAAGCGADKTPAEKCDDIVSELCTRGVQCLPNAGTYDQCVQQVQQSLPCGKAKSVGPSYDRCLGELQADSCPVLFPSDPQTGAPTLALPADCMGVVLMRTLPPLTPGSWNARGASVTAP